MMTDKAWWGDFSFDPDKGQSWRLAGLEVRLSRRQGEWRIETRRPADQHEDIQDWRHDPVSPEELPEARLQRFLFRQTTPRMRMLPRLADRPVVIKPVSPLFIAPGQSATLFVSTPVWVNAWVDGMDKPLLDIPVVRPSDTWFGASPIRGQLAYATKVFGRTDLAHLPVRPFRAVTPVTIANDSADAMQVERVCLPAPQLDVHAGEDGRLWTPGLRVERPAHTRLPKVLIESRHPDFAGRLTRLSPARENDAGALGSMFDHFFD